MKKYLILFVIALIISSCNKDEEIRQLLNSERPYEIIKGAYEAAESGNQAYVPLLLHNAGDPRATTELHFKGITVYEEKMFALEKILKVKPPRPYNYPYDIPDSTDIKFFNGLWQKMNKSK
jgi:hypothetical protein